MPVVELAFALEQGLGAAPGTGVVEIVLNVLQLIWKVFLNEVEEKSPCIYKVVLEGRRDVLLLGAQVLLRHFYRHRIISTDENDLSCFAGNVSFRIEGWILGPKQGVFEIAEGDLGWHGAKIDNLKVARRSSRVEAAEFDLPLRIKDHGPPSIRSIETRVGDLQVFRTQQLIRRFSMIIERDNDHCIFPGLVVP